MADEVVGKVTVEVHGDTDPLKRDIQQAAHTAGAGVGPEVASAIDEDSSITNAIVGQVDDAAKPAEKSGQRTGRFIAKGVREGAEKDLDVSDMFDVMFDDLDKSVRKRTDTLGISVRQKVDEWIRADDADQHRLAENLLGPDLVRQMEEAFGRAKALAQKRDVEGIHFVDDRALMIAQRDLEKLADHVQAMFAKSGEDSGKAYHRGLQKEMKKAVSGGIFDVLIKGIALKFGALGGAIAFGIRAAAPVIIGLTSQISAAVTQLGTALGGLGIVGGGAIATLLPNMIALKFAFKDLDKDAKKALVDRFKTAAGDLQKFGQNVRNGLLDPLEDAVRNVAKLAPEFNKFGKESGAAAGRVAVAFSKVLVGRRKELSEILGNSSKLLERIGTAVSKMIGPLLGALAAMQPLITRTVNAISSGIENLASRLDAFVRSGRFEKKLGEWYDQGLLLLQGFKNLGRAIWNFFGIASDASGGFLEGFEKVTREWADWTESLAGQNTLKAMFDGAKPVIHEVWGLLGDIAGLFDAGLVTGDTSGLLGFIKMLREDIIPGIEALQKMLRESGIQEALYDLASALGKVFTAGGGTTTRIFLQLLTNLVNVLADLLDILGPITPAILGLIGAFKGAKMVKTFSENLFGLTKLFPSLEEGAEGVQGAIEGAGDAAGKASGKLGKLQTGLSAASEFAGIALTGLTIAQTVIAQTVSHVEDFDGLVDDMVKKLKTGTDAIKTLDQTGVHGAAGLFSSGAKDISALNKALQLLGPSTAKPRSAIDKLVRSAMGLPGLLSMDTGETFDASKRLKDLGFDIANIDELTDTLKASFVSVGEAAGTDNWVDMQRNLTLLKTTMEEAKVDTSQFSKEMGGAQAAIANAARAAQEAEGGFTGVFGKGKKAVENFGFAWSASTQAQLDALKNVDRYIDPLTGMLTKAGKEARRKIIIDADVDSINGVNQAIDEETSKKVRQVFLKPEFVDPNGVLTAEGELEVNAIISVGLEDNKKELEKHRTTMERIFTEKPVTLPAAFRITDPTQVVGDLKRSLDFGQFALKTYLPKENKDKITSDVKALFGAKLLERRVELEAIYGPGSEELVAQALATESKTILVQAKIQQAKTDIIDLFNSIPALKTKVQIGDTLVFEDQVMKLTEKGWTVDVTADPKTAETTLGTLTEEGRWDPVIKPILDPTSMSAADSGLTDLTKTEDKTINVHFNIIPPEGPYSGYISTGGSQATPTPPSGNDRASRSAPSMLTMGAPTTIPGTPSPESQFSRGGVTVDMPISYVGNARPRDTERRAPITVVINNHYPEPERASDSVAMSLRTARHVLTGV